MRLIMSTGQRTLSSLRSNTWRLNAASWLVILGAIVLLGEHPFFAIAYSVPLITNEGPMILLPHARVHFFMAGIYTTIGLVLLCVIARTLLREGRRAGWYAILFALLFGGGFDIFAGAFFYSHGFPFYKVFTGVPVQGFGWQYLYLYVVAWIVALLISFRPVFKPTDK
jgi:hypothetical protein